MGLFRALSTSEQLVEHLKQQIHRGAFAESMPGTWQLIRKLGVNSSAVAQALRQLEKAGLLVSQGPGRPRKTALPQDDSAARNLRVRILLHEKKDRGAAGLLAKLQEVGFDFDFAEKALRDLAMRAREERGKPKISRISFDDGPVIRRVARWARNVAQGKDDRRQNGTKAKFIEGGTIGAVPKGRR